MTQPGRAAIEIVGDASKLGPQLERDAQRAINSVDIDTTNISKQIGDGFRRGADDAIDAFDDMDEHFARTARNIRRDSDSMFDRLGRGARDAAQDVQGNLLRPLTSGFSRLGEVISSAGSALAGLALTGTNPAGLITLALAAGAVATAIPVIIGLAAALADLAGFVTLLPAAVGGAVSSIIVLTVAFQGFGDAITAIIDGDPEKIAEALEKLAPAARQVAREFERVLPIFRQVGDEIQQGFFGQLTGIVERFGNQTLPALRGELQTLSAVLGRAFANLGGLLTSTENVGILERLLASTARITDDLGAAFTRLGQAFFNSIDAGLPSLEALSTRLADAISGFADFVTGAIADGSFQAFLDDAVATLDELLDLGAAVGELLGVLFSGTDDAGRGFLGTLTDVTQRMTEFFKSAEGQDALQDFSEIIDAAGIILGAVINVTREFIDVFTDLDDAVNSTIGWFVDLGEVLGTIWGTIVNVVSAGIETIVGFFSALPERIGTFVDSIPGRVGAAFQALADAALTALAFLIAGVVVFFTDLPGQIVGALAALVTLLATTWDSVVLKVTETFTRAREFIVTTWENVLAFISGLPGRIGTFFQQVNDAVVARVAALIEYVQSLPGRIIAAIGNLGQLLYSAGGNVIQGLIDGIGSRIGALRDKIASAVQMIRDHLPFSPAKTGPLSGSGSPRIAGAVIAEMIAAGLDAGTPLITQAAGRVAGAAASPFGAIGQAGVIPLASPTPGQPGTVLSPTAERVDEQVVVLVTIGGEEVYAIIDKRVEAAVSTEVRRLMAGTRGI